MICHLAVALQKQGYKITGSDDFNYEDSHEFLKEYGLLPEKRGWFPEKIHRSLDAVVVDMHTNRDNPELKRALELGIKIYSYPELLYQYARNKTRVVIGGSQGSAVLASMILHVMNYHQKAVDYVVEAPLERDDSMVHLTKDNDFILLEGEESFVSSIDPRSKFLCYQPNIALLSGISTDYPKIFSSDEDYWEQFKNSINAIVNGGIIVYNEEDSILSRLVEETLNPIRKHPYSTPNYRIEDGMTILDTPEGDMPLELFGEHLLKNLIGAKWICQHMGVDENDFYEAIESFREGLEQ